MTSIYDTPIDHLDDDDRARIADEPEPEDLDRRDAKPVTKIADDWPPTLLRAAGLTGALLTAGEILVLAGDGGTGKTSLLLGVLLGIAGRDATGLGPLPGGVFVGVGGPVLYAAHEDRASIIASLARWASASGPWAKADEELRRAALERVFVLPMRARALYGPKERGGNSGPYNSRPEPLPGWADLWRAADKCRPRVIVVDPALSAYVGDSNSAAPVREFLDAMRQEAEERKCGLIIAAHSIKSSRQGQRQNQRPDPFDAGQVGGSTAWVDAPRGVLTFTQPYPGDDRTLAVLKANYGPRHRLLDVVPDYRYGPDPHDGALTGFHGAGAWQTHAEWKAKHEPTATATAKAEDAPDAEDESAADLARQAGFDDMGGVH